MRIFMTGGTGWIGRATVPLLLAAGHTVEALARTRTAETQLRKVGADVRRGSLDDLAAITAGSAESDGVIHLANKHDFTDPAGTNTSEHNAVDAIGTALSNSDRPFVLASVLTAIAPGRVATEADPSPFHGVQSLRGGSENLALSYAERGVKVTPIRFAPAVHGAGDPGLTAALVDIAVRKRESGYLAGGANQWAAIHVSDAADLVVAAIEAAPGGTVLHAVGEAGVPTRAIADAIAAGLHAPCVSIDAVAAENHFGWLGTFFGMDLRADNTATRALVNWNPTGPTLLQDLHSGSYFLH